MFSKNIIFHQGPIQVLEKRTTPTWCWKTGILTQSGLIILTSKLTEEKIEGKIKLGKIQIGLCKSSDLWQIDLQQEKKITCFRVDSQESGEKWHKSLTFASSWVSYKQFCEMQKVQPWIRLLKFAVKGKQKLVVDLNTINSFALTEFLKGNCYIEELVLQGLKNEVIVLSRILITFRPGQLKVLCLARSGMTDKALEKSKKPIKSLNYLISLDLSYNEFTVKSIPVLFQVFSKTPYLENFCFSGHLLGDEGFELLFPEILTQIPVKNVELVKCGFTDAVLGLVCLVLKLEDFPLHVLDLSQNLFTVDGLKSIFKTQNKIHKGFKIDLKVFPLSVDGDIVKYVDDGVYVLERNMIKRSLPTDYRTTVETISKKISSLDESPYIEDLVDLINDLIKLAVPLPRTKQEKIEKIVNEYLNIAVAQPNFYCLEILVPVIRKIGFRHPQAEDQLQILSNEVEHILSTLESVLTPSLYTKENIPELNSLLDSVLRRCDEICVRGEIVQVAKMLKSKRDEWLKKLRQ